MQQHSFWRLPRVEAETGYKRSSVYRLVKVGRFPRPIKLGGGRASAWIADEVRAWITECIDQSRKAA